MWWTPISEVTTLRVGRLAKVHGLKGAFKLELYTDSPNERFTPGAKFELQVPEDSPWFGKNVTVKELRWHNQVPYLLLEEVDTRSQAETLVRAILLFSKPAGELPRETNAWYDHQLVGLRVLRQGATVGTVARVDHLPAQDILVVKTPNGEVLLPFVGQFVPDVNVAAGEIHIQPPGGLFEDLTNED